MAAKSFQEIVGNALIDSDFRKALLNGSRRRILQTFDLTPDEFEALMAMRGDSLEQLASDMHTWLLHAQGQHEINPPTILRHSPSHLTPALD